MARAVPVPNPYDSDKEYDRFYHYDLADMTTEGLLVELCGTRYSLWLLKSGRFGYILSPFEQGRRTQWLEDRISRIKAELGRQGYVRKPAKTEPRPRPKLAEGVRL